MSIILYLCFNNQSFFFSFVYTFEFSSNLCVLQGIPYISAIDQTGDRETLTSLALHLLLILIEYKPPSIDNLRYLINGGHPSLKKIYTHFFSQGLSVNSS